VNGLVPQHCPDSLAILDADHGEEVTFGQLLDRVTRTADCLKRELGRGLVFHLAMDTADAIVLYLACLEAGCPVVLLEPGWETGWIPSCRLIIPMRC